MVSVARQREKSIFSFADSDAGWAIFYNKMAYTSNGGKSWVSREINFPEMVNDSSFPVRDRGYVVGNARHGLSLSSRTRRLHIERYARGTIVRSEVARERQDGSLALRLPLRGSRKLKLELKPNEFEFKL